MVSNEHPIGIEVTRYDLQHVVAITGDVMARQNLGHAGYELLKLQWRFAGMITQGDLDELAKRFSGSGSIQKATKLLFSSVFGFAAIRLAIGGN